LLRACRQHQDRCLRSRAPAADQVHAVGIGQAEVDDQQLRRRLREFALRLRAGGGGARRHAGGAQARGDELRDGAVVLDEEDVRAHRRWGWWWGVLRTPPPYEGPGAGVGWGPRTPPAG